MNHFYGIHTEYPTIASGQGGAPFKRHGLREQPEAQSRLRGQHRHGDCAVAQGRGEGVVDTKLTVRNMIEQLDGQLKLKPEGSPYFGPVKELPDGIRAADRTRMTNEYRAVISDELYPALTRLRDFLKNEYLATRARASA